MRADESTAATPTSSLLYVFMMLDIGRKCTLRSIRNESLANHVLSSTDRLNPMCQAQRA